MSAAHVVAIAAVVCPPVQGRLSFLLAVGAGALLPHTSCGCEPCLVFVFSVHGPVPLPAFNMTRPSPILALVALGLFKLENGVVCGEW